jgi:hypothetical protein
MTAIYEQLATIPFLNGIGRIGRFIITPYLDVWDRGLNSSSMKNGQASNPV